MLTEISYAYSVWVIPPFETKHRFVGMRGFLTLRIPEATAKEAPVAIIERPQMEWDKKDWDHDRRGPFCTYRWWNGNLYKRFIPRSPHQPPRSQQTAAEFEADRCRFDDTDWALFTFPSQASNRKRRAKLRKWAATILFIDGVRWTVTPEPRYAITTRGEGGDQIDNHGTELSAVFEYKQYLARDRYFRIDQFKEAKTHTACIARARGDAGSLPVEKASLVTRYIIRIPEAIRLDPSIDSFSTDFQVNLPPRAKNAQALRKDR